MFLTPASAALLFLVAADDAKARYARPELLLEPAELKKPEAARQFRILDAREGAKYRAGHVPGAAWVDHDRWAKEYADRAGQGGWDKALGQLGIDADTKVVVYDDVRFNRAARVWWLLRALGVRDVRLLNGGWRGWVDGGGEVSTEASAIKPVQSHITYQPDQHADKQRVLEAIKDKGAQIIDARSAGEYRGTDQRAKRCGAMPGAVHLEWSDAIDANTGRFKSADELGRLLKDAGIDLARPSITYCQSGGRASVMAFTLELMGAKDVRNYYKSWAEWGNADDTPVVQPK